jgi:tRNA C32,U32 (ribose-2'-O)-methylase TrmJ
MNLSHAAAVLMYSIDSSKDSDNVPEDYVSQLEKDLPDSAVQAILRGADGSSEIERIISDLK